MNESEIYFNDETMDDCNQQISICFGNKETNYKKEDSSEENKEEEEKS